MFRNAAEWSIAGQGGTINGSSTRNHRGGNVVGTRVALEEVEVTEPANVTWAEPVFLDQDGNPASTLEFTTTNANLGKLTEITLTNTTNLQQHAGFSASKTVVNEDGVPLADDLTFALNYSYPADVAKGIPAGSGTLNMPINGNVVASSELLVGAVVTLSEPNLPNIPGATWGRSRHRTFHHHHR